MEKKQKKERFVTVTTEDGKTVRIPFDVWMETIRKIKGKLDDSGKAEAESE